MSTDPRAPRIVSIGVLLLLGLACLLYLALMHDIVPSPAREFIQRGEPASNAIERGLTELIAFVLIFLLWIVLAILLFLGRKGQKMPLQALVAAAILLPLSGVAAIYASDLYASYAGWAIVVPALLPPLIALYAMWMHLPALRAALAERGDATRQQMRQCPSLRRWGCSMEPRQQTRARPAAFTNTVALP